MGNKNTQIQIIVGVISTGLSILYIMKKNKKEDKDVDKDEVIQQQIQQKDQQIDQQQELVQDDENKILKQLCCQIQVKYKDSIIEIESITKFYDFAVELMKNDYIQLTQNNRQQRRRLKQENRINYDDMVIEYNQNVDQLFEKYINLILQELKVQKQQYEQSINHLVQNQVQQLIMIQSQARQKLKFYIKSQINIDLQQLLLVINQESKILQEKQQIFENVNNKISKKPIYQSIFPLVINTILMDEIFEQFQYEEEDLMNILMDGSLIQNQELHEGFMKLEVALQQLLTRFGINESNM